MTMHTLDSGEFSIKSPQHAIDLSRVSRKTLHIQACDEVTPAYSGPKTPGKLLVAAKHREFSVFGRFELPAHKTRQRLYKNSAE